MVFTEEDHVVIKFLRQNKGYSARRMVKEFLLKKMEKWQFEQTTDSDFCCLCLLTVT